MALVCSNQELSILFQETETLLVILPNSLALKRKNYSSMLETKLNCKLTSCLGQKGNTLVELIEKKMDIWIKTAV